MKTFKFLAKQGQHDQIARLLTAKYHKPKLVPYKGRRGEGVMVTLEIPLWMSKRKIDK